MKQAMTVTILLAGALCAQNPSTSAAAAAEGAEAQQQGGGFRRVDDPARDVASRPRGERMSDRVSDRAVDLRPTMLPESITIPAGTMVALRVNDMLSSDRNQAGDSFTATLTQPLIADGFVIARRGQMLAGRVAEAVRAGKAKGTSRLALEFTELQVADGRQVPVVTQLIQYAGGTSKGRDATAVGMTSGLGAMIGAAAGGGSGAAISAGAGAAAAAIGVLLTRGRATEVWPEATLTLRLMSPVTVDTARAPHAFLQVRQDDYEPRQQTLQRRPAQQQPGWGGPVFWGGPSIFWANGGGWGPGWGRRGFYRGRGWGWGGGTGWWW